MSKFYITTPIYYVNAAPHIGHAYTSIVCDCLARYHRLKNDEVFYLTGTDEHGEKIKKAAEAAGMDTQAFVDKVSQNFKELWSALNIKYDFYIRTSQENHKKSVQEAIKKLYQNGDIYKAKYHSLYCLPCESFWTETQIKDAGGKCPDCQRPIEEIEEENYFFKLSKYADWLKQYLKDNPAFVQPRIRHNEVMGFLENNPLTDLCISRPKKRVSWGIDLPIDGQYVVYVWFDALLNYITGIEYGINNEKFNKWWPADMHVMAKDILRHHAIFWPIMLKALDLPLPKVIFAHGWWKIDNQKMSKSLGNIVNPYDVIKEIGVDGFRYFLCREIALGADGNFSWNALYTRYNSDLANDLGNLVYRTLNMAEKYTQGQVNPDSTAIPESFKNNFQELQNNYLALMDKTELSSALEKISGLMAVMNKYVEETKPWNLAKEKKEAQIRDFLYSLLEGIRVCAIYLSPFIPATSESIIRQLGLSTKDISLSDAVWGKVRSYSIKKEAPLFPRIDIKEMTKQEK